MRRLTLKQKKKSFHNCKKDSRYSETATESYIGVLNFLFKSPRNNSKRLHFGKASGHMTVVLLKGGTRSHAFFKILPIDSVIDIWNKRNKHNTSYCVPASKNLEHKSRDFKQWRI